MKKEIIKIITFFDLFDYPLTAFEIWKYLGNHFSLIELIEKLESIDIVKQEKGFYFLSARHEIIDIRRKRYNYSNRKIKIAKYFVKAFSLLPFIKLIAISNSIGERNLRDEGDIDFFIITSSKRIWLSRFFCASLAKILYSRPTENNKKDKICLSFYVSEDHLNLNDLRLPDKDPYFDYWLAGLIILYNKDNIYNRFIDANKGLNYDNKKLNKRKIGNFLEGLAKKIQLRFMFSKLKENMNNSQGVVINDSVLKLYLKDNRQKFLQRYENKINKIIKGIN